MSKIEQIVTKYYYFVLMPTKNISHFYTTQHQTILADIPSQNKHIVSVNVSGLHHTFIHANIPHRNMFEHVLSMCISCLKGRRDDI